MKSMQIRRGEARGHIQHGWLDTYHTFSFADYFDPAHMGFRALRVINEDRVAPGQGFGMHGHLDMEILTYVLSGQLEHRDSLGNGSVLRAGELQRMTAGTGIRHSEYNPSSTEPVHLYQVWLLPEAESLPPSYEQKPFAGVLQPGRWQRVATRDGRDGSLRIYQDAEVCLAAVTEEASVSWHVRAGRHVWLQVVRGAVEAGGEVLSAGDGAALAGEAALAVRSRGSAEVMLFDLA